VPFPLVIVFTMLREGMEISVPGFGDEEINGNRLTDIGVAWLGWAVFAGISAAVTRQPFPFGLRGSDYTRDRLRVVVAAMGAGLVLKGCSAWPPSRTEWKHSPVQLRGGRQTTRQPGTASLHTGQTRPHSCGRHWRVLPAVA
jgi:hypothetical protein